MFLMLKIPWTHCTQRNGVWVKRTAHGMGILMERVYLFQKSPKSLVSKDSKSSLETVVLKTMNKKRPPLWNVAAVPRKAVKPLARPADVRDRSESRLPRARACAAEAVGDRTNGGSAFNDRGVGRACHEAEIRRAERSKVAATLSHVRLDSRYRASLGVHGRGRNRSAAILTASVNEAFTSPN